MDCSQPYSYVELLAYNGPVSYKAEGSSSWSNCILDIRQGNVTFQDIATGNSKMKSLKIDSTYSISADTVDPLVFFIACGDNNLYTIRCDNKTETKKWVEILSAFVTPMKHYKVEDFRIISVIGRGCYGKVMLVQDKETLEYYALKTVQKAKVIELGRPSAIISERNIMMLINNPFVVRLNFAFQTDKKFYLGLEYAPGGELFYRMETHGLIPVDDARLYIAEIALALNHLHSLNIVYRDLKPENVLFDLEGHIKLADFGLAKDLMNQPTTTTFCGTNHYLAPEIIQGKPYSYAVDWWALGILLCEMLSGATPFHDENKSKMFESIVNDPPSVSITVDDEACDLIVWLLDKDPETRPDFEQISTHPFFSCLDWEFVLGKRYLPNVIPELTCMEDVTYFNPEFTDEPTVDSDGEEPPDISSLRIEGFSFEMPDFNDIEEPEFSLLNDEPEEEEDTAEKELADMISKLEAQS